MSEAENNYNQEEEVEERSWPRWWIAIPVLLVLSLAGNGFLYYKYYKSTHAENGQTYEEQYKNAVSSHEMEKAELTQELADIKAQLEAAIQNNSGLSGFNDSLKAQLDEKSLRIGQLIQKASLGDPVALRKAREEIASLKELNAIFQTQNDSLIKLNSELIAKVLETESNLSEVKVKTKMLEDEKTVTDEKIKNSTLSVADLKVVGIRVKGSNEEETLKAKKVSRLKISFTLLENELVPAGDKEIVIRLLGTSNEVLTENNPALTDTDKLISLKEVINYQNKLLKVKYDYSQASKYKKGTYTIEILHNSKLMGRSSFTLN